MKVDARLVGNITQLFLQVRFCFTGHG